MACPLRLEFLGAVYHLIARGKARQDIFLDETDRDARVSHIQRAIELREPDACLQRLRYFYRHLRP